MLALFRHFLKASTSLLSSSTGPSSLATLSVVTIHYRGRIAPSPTGLLHAGHARTFWVAYQRCRDAAGTLVFRNEDLDPQRSRPEFEQAMFEDLRWLGIRWQEGPDVGGPFAPYAQSQRCDLYLAAWKQLLQSGAIYPCKCSRKDLERSAQAPHEGRAARREDDEPLYPGTCRPRRRRQSPIRRPISRRESTGDSGFPTAKPIEFHDQHFGSQSFVAGRDFGDFLVWRRDDVPAYQLAVVVDDAAMQITEVVRGADLIKSTARQLLLYRALGLAPPLWYHCPLVTEASGQRLAKRHDALALRGLAPARRNAREYPQPLQAS